MINAANVREFWEVHELEFYWDSQCTLPFPVGLPIASDVMTSFPGNTEDMAWDGDLLTKWSANCRVLLGGCSPYTQWVGKNIGDSIPLNKEPVEIFAQVRCTRIYQSPNATRQASEIAIITWEDEKLDSWQIIYDYGDLAGGAWHTRPAREESLWRIWNMDPMPRPWQVAEVMFFTDLFCEEDKQAFGAAAEKFSKEGCKVRVCHPAGCSLWTVELPICYLAIVCMNKLRLFHWNSQSRLAKPLSMVT